MPDNKKPEEKLISLALLFCTLLIFILYLLNYSELSAKSNPGLNGTARQPKSLNLLSNPSIKQTKVNSTQASDSRQKMITDKPKSMLEDSRQLNIKPSILWQPPNARYVLYEMNKSLNQEREEKVLEHLTQIELRRNPRLKKAFKVYNAASLKQFFYLIGGFFNNHAQISNSRGAYEYISKIKQEQLKLVKEYLSFFSSDLNFKNIDTAHEKEVIETISKKYSFQTLNYINHLYSRFPYYYETQNNRSAPSLDKDLERDENVKNEVVHLPTLKNHSPELCLSHGRILLISLDSLKIGTFLISDESLVKVYKLNTSVLAVEALGEKGAAELIINTKQGLIRFNLNIGKSHSADFSLMERNRSQQPEINESTKSKMMPRSQSYKLKILPSSTVSMNSLITIKLNSRIEGSVLASNSALLELKHLVSSQDDQFLRIFLLKIKNTVGITDIVVPAEKVIYKFTLEVNKAAALRSEINEIFLD
jgi:hypothetical protein